MEIASSGVVPTKLFAFLLRLRPIQEGTLMPFTGELVHAAWLDWLRSAAPDVAAWLHEGNKRRLFTCSSLQFPLPREKMLEVERRNVHWPVTPEKTYAVRITLLLGELFPLFYKALMEFHLARVSGSKSPFMRIGKQMFLLEEVILENHDAASWTGFTTFVDLVQAAKAQKPGESLKLEFASLTTFNRGDGKKRTGDFHYARLPLPQYVFPQLAKRWQELAPPELAGIVQKERIQQYMQDEDIFIVDYDLKSHTVKFTTHWQPGFIGTCHYHLRGPDEPVTEEAPLTVRQQIALLGQWAFYCGVGYKTAMGMGQTRTLK